MTASVTQLSQVYTDPQALARLKAAARDASPDTIKAVAAQFEALFVQMMLKSMRDASFGGGLFDSDQSRFYQDLFDKQLSVKLSEGQGLGLAEMLTRQLGGLVRSGAAPPASERAHPMVLNPSQDPFAATRVEQAPAAPSHDAPLRRAYGPRPQGAAVITHDGSAPQNKLQSAEAFVSDLWPHAQRAAEELGLAPEVLIAQAALETGWGKSVPRHPDGRSSHNLFGIKAGRGWSGSRVTLPTVEFEEGAAVRRSASFRAYDSFAQSFVDYVELLRSSPRYAAALEAVDQPENFLQALQHAGYATDPAYARKITGILNSASLTEAVRELKSGAEQPITDSGRPGGAPGGHQEV